MTLQAFAKEMQINLEEVQARSAATELQVFGRFDTYMRTWEEDRGRPKFITKHGRCHRAMTQDPQFDKGFRRSFGLVTPSRVGGADIQPRKYRTQQNE